MMKRNRCIVALGAVMFVLLAEADEYVATSTWFSVSTQGLTESPTTGAEIGVAGKWAAVPATQGGVNLKNGKVNIKTDHTTPLRFAPITTTEPVTRVSAKVKIAVCKQLPDVLGETSGVCVAPDADDTLMRLKWHMWNGSSWNACNEFASSDDGEEFEVTLETVVTNKAVKYSARKLPDGVAFDICGWTACAGLTAPITNLSFYGSTTLGDFSGLGVRKVNLEPGVQPENIEVVVIQGRPGSAILVDKSSTWVTKYGASVPPAEKGGMNAAAKNGLTYLQSYVLGLDPTSAVAKPLVTATQNPEPTMVAFRLGGVSVNRSSGARVKYRVKTFAKPDGTGLEATSDPVSYEQSTLLDVPTAAAPVKYYRIDLSIE